MRCPACSHENRPEARFCGECARPTGLQLGCTTCGAVNPPGQKFCDRCGARLTDAPAHGAPREPHAYTPAHLAEKILVSRSALEGERKQVTVLFADVQGSMDLAERVDAEEWHRILDGFFAILSDGIHRFEGTINQFTGDGVMALFGAPIAHEDHARRACHSALALSEELARYARELRRTRGLNFSVRMGLNSGEVIVGKIGDDLRMDYTAQGRTVGLAARVQQLAASDRAYLTEMTAALVSGYFELADLGEFAIKGVRDPVRVYDLIGLGPARTRLERSAARGFSRFVGRSEESHQLDEALERALASDAAVVALVAEAGVGKSRLTHEFIDRCRARGIAVHVGHCVAHGRTVPLLPVHELLRSYFSITERDDDAEARRKVAGTLVLLDEAFQEGLPLIFEFLGIADPERPAPRLDPEARGRQILAFERHVLEARSRREPTVLVFEDLHWADGASEVFIANLAAALPGTRTLLLVNFRPEYSAPWLAAPHARVLPLAPLGARAISELLSDLLGTDPSLGALPERIRHRAGGNPFFVEEVVQSLAEAGVLGGRRGAYRLLRDPGEPAIPATVQAVLAARIDRLEEGDKSMLQTAAVIGKEFPLPILAQVSSMREFDVERILDRLAAAEFVYPSAFIPQALYAFKHPLTQEVAYQSQLSERRCATHAAVARALSALPADRVEGIAGLVAHHWESAGEPLEAARWWRRAAEWAETRNVEDSLRHWHKVRALVDTMEESPETLMLGVLSRAGAIGLGIWHGDAEKQAARLFAEAKALSTRLGDPRAAALLEAAYSGVLSAEGDVRGAVEHSAEGARLAEQAGDEGLGLVLRVTRVYAFEVAGRVEEALALIEEALARAPIDPGVGTTALGFSPYSFLTVFHGEMLTHVGRLAEAREQLERGLALAERLREPEIVVLAHGFFCFLARCSGEAELARRHAPLALQVAEKAGSPLARGFAHRSIGLSHLMRNEFAPAADAFEKALEIGAKSRTAVWAHAFTLADLAEAYLGLERFADAREMAARAVSAAERAGSKNLLCHARLARVRVRITTDGPAAAAEIEAELEALDAYAREAGQRAYGPHVHLAHAQLAEALGDGARRRRALQDAARTFAALGAQAHARATMRRLSELESREAAGAST